MSLNITTREVGDVIVIDLRGKITLGEATGKVRETIQQVLGKNHKKILLNLGALSYMDSAGLGEVVGAYTTVANRGGQLKLLSVTGRTLDLMQVTKLTTVFEFFDDEAAAIISFA